MKTEPFADQPATSQPAHWHVFADGPGTGPACVFGTDDPLDERLVRRGFRRDGQDVKQRLRLRGLCWRAPFHR